MDINTPTIEPVHKKSGLGIIILIVLALVIVGIILGMKDTKENTIEQQTIETNTTDDTLYNDVDSIQQNLDSAQFEGSAETL